jgi:hypothetical protein
LASSCRHFCQTDQSAISKSAVWHSAGHSTVESEINIKDSPQAALWTLPEPCGKRNDKAAPSGESELYQQVSPTHPRSSVDKDLAKNNGSEIPPSLTGLPERPSLLERPNFSQYPAHDR